MNRLYGTLKTYNPNIECIFVILSDDEEKTLVKALKGIGHDIKAENRRHVIIGLVFNDDETLSEITDYKKVYYAIT